MLRSTIVAAATLAAIIMTANADIARNSLIDRTAKEAAAINFGHLFLPEFDPDTIHIVGCDGPVIQKCIQYGGKQFYGNPDRPILGWHWWDYTPFVGEFESIFVHTSSSNPNQGRGFIGVLNAEVDPEPGVAVQFISTEETQKFYSLSAWENAVAQLE